MIFPSDGGTAVESPVASVVLCVRNSASTIAEQVESLSKQDLLELWELVIVDNGCTDDTIARVRATWRHPTAALRVVPADERAGLAYARNVGVQASRAERVAFCDGDDIAEPGWLAAILEELDRATVVGGHLAVERLNPTDVVYWRGGSPTANGLPRAHGFLAHAVGANFAVRRASYLEAGGCDEQFVICSDDVDLCWRLQEAGGSLHFAPNAVMQYRLRQGLRETVRQQWNYGIAEGALKRKFGSRMPRDRASVFLVVWLTLLLRPDHLLRTRKLRGRWLSVAAYRTGRLVGARRHGVWWW